MNTQGMVKRCASGPTRSSQVSAVVVGTQYEGALYIHRHWKDPLQFIYPGVPPSGSAVLTLCLFAQAGIAGAGSNVSSLLLTSQSCTHGERGSRAPEFVLRLP